MSRTDRWRRIERLLTYVLRGFSVRRLAFCDSRSPWLCYCCHQIRYRLAGIDNSAQDFVHNYITMTGGRLYVWPDARGLYPAYVTVGSRLYGIRGGE